MLPSSSRGRDHLLIVLLDVPPKRADHDHSHEHGQEHDDHAGVRDTEPVDLIVGLTGAVDVPPEATRSAPPGGRKKNETAAFLRKKITPDAD